MARTSNLTKRILEKSLQLLSRDYPITLRHLFYLLVSHGVLQNQPSDYRRLARVTCIARRTGLIPFDSLIDNMRTSAKPSSWSGLLDFGEEMSAAYRKDLWAGQRNYIEFWIEKDAIASVVSTVTWNYDVRIRPLRGYSSLTFLRQASS